MRRRYVSAMTSLAVVVAVAASLRAEVSVKQWVFRGGDPKGRAAHLALKKRFWASGKYPADPALLSKMVALSTGKTEFLLWFRGKVDAANTWRATVGMGRPSNVNWYQNDFYEVHIGRKAGHQFKTELVEAKGGEEGVVTCRWSHDAGVITTRFVLRDGDDKLLIETRVAAKGKAKRYTVKLIAYPSSAAGGYSRGLKTRDREALTPKRTLRRPAKKENRGYVNATLTKDEPWVLLYDKHYDRDLNRGDGPCAMAYPPRQATSARVSVQNYGCFVWLAYPVNSPSHIAVWDFKGLGNKAAMEYMKALVVE